MLFRMNILLSLSYLGSIGLTKERGIKHEREFHLKHFLPVKSREYWEAYIHHSGTSPNSFRSTKQRTS